MIFLRGREIQFFNASKNMNESFKELHDVVSCSLVTSISRELDGTFLAASINKHLSHSKKGELSLPTNFRRKSK